MNAGLPGVGFTVLKHTNYPLHFDLPFTLQAPERVVAPLNWVGHIPFAFYIVSLMRPKVLVELGVHSGNSYLSFCQAVHRLDLDTRCFAIDTWQGDEHSGSYEQTVYQKLKEYHNPRYNQFSTLVQATFDEAVSLFKERSIDLLHIDGLHTYDAVKHDFETWHHKLSDHGVILLHDIHVKEKGYGVWLLWNELKKKYRHIEFQHSSGLGVLFVGASIPNEKIENISAYSPTVFEVLGEKIHNQYWQKISYKVTARLYPSFKTGYAEDKSIEKDIAILEKKVEFDIPEYTSKLLYLRFDPLEDHAIVRIDRILVVDKNNQAVEIENFHTNALQSENNLFLFVTKDPQIVIDVVEVEKPKKIIFDFEIIQFGPNSLSDQLFDITAEYQKRMLHLREGYQNRISHLHDVISDLNSWKQQLKLALFNAPYYLKQYPDAVKSSLSPLGHFIEIGIREGRSTSPLLKRLRDLYHTRAITFLYKMITVIKINGFSYFLKRIKQRMGYLVFRQSIIEENNEAKWLNENRLTKEKRRILAEDISKLPYHPLISILLPVYNVDRKWLVKAIESVTCQLYPNWELCIVDDASNRTHISSILEKYAKKNDRIKVKYLKPNQGIAKASNEAIAMATGEFIGLLDHDDELAENALYEITKTINNNTADIIYSDEVIIDTKGNPVSIHFKPDFSPDLLFSHNYITHFLVVRKSIIDDIGGFSSNCDGAQDYDLVLKLSERTSKIHHIPKVLYRWRSIPGSTSANPEEKAYADDAGKEALQKALERRAIEGDVFKTEKKFFYRVKRHVDNLPLVSIIIPFKDKSEYIKKCIESILNKSTYQQFEIIGINNNSIKKKTFSVMRTLTKADNRIRFHDYQIPFNFSRICNHAVTLAKGEHVVLMNNDIEIITLDWIESLLEHSQRKEIGAVGAKLYYSDDTIQHAGVILGISGFAGHSHRHLSRDESGYHNRLMIIQNLSAVTGALLMVEKKKYNEVQGFDEVNFQISLNDVDFCLKLREKGYLNVFTPFCEAYHHESISRGYEDTPEKQKRFHKEILSFQNKWQHILQKGDPYYNPNLTIDRENFSLNG